MKKGNLITSRDEAYRGYLIRRGSGDGHLHTRGSWTSAIGADARSIGRYSISSQSALSGEKAN